MPRLHQNHKCKLTSRNTILLKKSQINGYHESVYTTQQKYSGDFENNIKHGRGKLEQSNGITYHGDWKYGKRNGYGVLRKNDEIIVLGMWKNNMKNGKCEKIFNTGKYTGMWKDNRRYGLGAMWYFDGTAYIGQWKDDLYNGIGTFFQKNGNRYEGEFRNGKREGNGKFYHIHTGQIQTGKWMNDICISSTMIDDERQNAENPTQFAIPMFSSMFPI